MLTLHQVPAYHRRSRTKIASCLRFRVSMHWPPSPEEKSVRPKCKEPIKYERWSDHTLPVSQTRKSSGRRLAISSVPYRATSVQTNDLSRIQYLCQRSWTPVRPCKESEYTTEAYFESSERANTTCEIAMRPNRPVPFQSHLSRDEIAVIGE